MARKTDTLLDLLITSIRQTQWFDPRVEAAPAAVFWPDGTGDWEPLIPSLRTRLHVLTFGDYAARQRRGPATWMRCMLARKLSDTLPPLEIPIIYLPGISADTLHDAGKRPSQLDLLVELHFRSTCWMRPDLKDWDVTSFLVDEAVGAGVEIRDDDYTKKAMRRVLPTFSKLTVAELQAENPWKARDFEALLEADITELIAQGEHAELEFKSTARWDMVEGKKNPILEGVIVKTVAGFLNSERGGTLLIGVEDNGNICGIEEDYRAISAKDQNVDAYERWLRTLLLQNTFGQEFASAIHVSFHGHGDKTVCKVIVDPAQWPAITTEKDAKSGAASEVFYLRTGNATNRLGLRELLNYHRKRWP